MTSPGAEVDLASFETQVSAAIIAAAHAAGLTVEAVQVGLAIDPAWRTGGPELGPLDRGDGR